MVFWRHVKCHDPELPQSKKFELKDSSSNFHFSQQNYLQPHKTHATLFITTKKSHTLSVKSSKYMHCKYFIIQYN